MTQIYADIIKARRAGGSRQDSEDMVWTFMNSHYRSGEPMPDTEIAHMMVSTFQCFFYHYGLSHILQQILLP